MMKSLRLRIVFGSFLVFHAIPGFCQKKVDLISPDGHIVYSLFILRENIFYRVTDSHQERVGASSLGMEMNGHVLNRANRLTLLKKSSIDERYPSMGVHSVATDRSNVYLVGLRTSQQETWQVEVKVFNDGVAFRYRVHTDGMTTITKDLSSFRLPSGCRIWYQKDTAYYEGEYKSQLIDSLKPGLCMGPPATIEYPGGGFAAITEGGLTNFPGMQLEAGGIMC